jgi:RimJ/RimL family protein N-acetyltransferase
MELRDAELALREWREEDAQAVFDACQDPEIQHWIPMIPRPYTLEAALAYVRGERRAENVYELAVTEDDRVVGAIGMTVKESTRTGHIGYWCAPEARGRGRTTRALRLLCRHAFDDLHLERLELVTDPDNVASQRVAENVGFTREGVLRSHVLHPDGRRRNSIMFSLLPGELR